MDPFYHATQQPTDIAQTSGIYKITCLTTGKFYVGSAVNLYARRHGHYGTLRRNEHHNPKLQNAFNKYGESDFSFTVLELVLIPFLIEREQHWIDKTQAVKKGFNIAPFAGSTLGRECAPETRAKISTANAGKSRNVGYKPTPETIEKHRLSLTGYKHTEETKRNMGDSHRGSTRSPETKEKMRQAALGHAVSPETAAKISAANKGRVPGAEEIAKVSAASKNRKRSIEEYESRRTTLIVTSPDGTEHIVCGIRQFAEKHGLDHSALSKVASGKYSNHKGWTARYTETD